MNLRVAAPADAPTIARLERSASPVAWSERSVRSLLEQPGCVAFVIDDPPAGHLLTRVVADEAEVLTLAVASEHRRRGLGRVLMRAAEAHWLALGVSTAWLEVGADNTAAQGLYRALGWAEAGRRAAYYSDGVDACVLRWSPPPARST